MGQKIIQDKMKQKTISNKKVLLVANSSLLSEEVLLHGINLSERMDASLEILHLLRQEPAHLAAKNFKDTISSLKPDEPVGYIQLVNANGLTTETVGYAKNRRNIHCVILCLKGHGIPRKKGIRHEKFKQITKLLNCPVVLYTDNPIQ